MTEAQTASRLLHTRPELLSQTDRASPDDMREAFEPTLGKLLEHYESESDLIAVQGEISSMKTWLLTHAAEELLSRGERVTVLAPQKVNRRTVADRLKDFGVPYIEHPSRLDLCDWTEWKERVRRVDEQTCSTNGCSLYPDGLDMEEAASKALGVHLTQTGGVLQLDTEAVTELARQLDTPVCPHYLHAELCEIASDRDAVRIATFAKTFEAAAAKDQLRADVVLLDEPHTVTADLDQSYLEVDVGQHVQSLNAAENLLGQSTDRNTLRTIEDLEALRQELEDWIMVSTAGHASPDTAVSGNHISQKDAFEALRQATAAVTESIKRGMGAVKPRDVERASEVLRQLQDLRTFLSRIRAYQDGDLDFVYLHCDAQGETIHDMQFRRVKGRNEGCIPDEVYRAWNKHGTHSAINDRWGGLLDHYIRAIWEGRTVFAGGDAVVPGSPETPLGTIRSVTGADTVIGFSATHNETSDPARSPDQLRTTAHDIAAAPLQLRSAGDERFDYHGKTAVDGQTPWFRSIVQSAKEETGDMLAAVPINASNATKWEQMPIEEFKVPDGSGSTVTKRGLVPYSRASIGAKNLESLSIDAVLCGVQVQGPAETAKRLVSFWELLAPEHDDPVEVLEKSWRLLAQHAVSGTIQAAGRFRTEAVNIVFERPELLELAGFECADLSTDMDGFAGSFARIYRDAVADHKRRQDIARATKVVRYLQENPSKAPTQAQYLSSFCEMYQADESEATEAFRAADDAGRVEYSASRLRLVREEGTND